MKALIRFVTRTAAGGKEHHDRIVDCDAITIGRATDQVLHVKDKHARLKHAEIRFSNGETRIVSSAQAGVVVNGRSQRDAILSRGDTIEVGANILRLLDPVDGADVSISFELRADAKSEDLAGSWQELRPGIGGFTKRRLSWLLAGAIILCALILPAIIVMQPSVAPLLRDNALLPDDSLWLAGPLHSAHSSISNDCQSCHQQAFTRVPDTACIDCHVVDRHVSPPAQAVLGEARCAGCHLEHSEPAQLVNRHQGLCADCHGDLATDAGIDNASDFLHDHPQFRVSLLTPENGPDGTLEWSEQHTLLAEAAGTEQSNLNFDHKVHLDPGGVISPDGRQVLDCVDCHQAEAGGARMQPIAMDQHCSGCHALSFDAEDPKRVVPHGDAEGVVQVLIEYYSARLLGEDRQDNTRRLRRPGENLSRQDRDRAATEARVQAMSVAEDLFERRVCANCHTVQRLDDGSAAPWQVVPVRLTASFFPHANFSHAAHDNEVTDCSSCHAAASSELSTDVLMPDLDTCRDCHGSGIARRNGATQVPSTCVMCHDFHLPTKGEHP